jgi:hypothetical protein
VPAEAGRDAKLLGALAAEVGIGLILYALKSSALIKTRLTEDARLVGDYEILFRYQK